MTQRTPNRGPIGVPIGLDRRFTLTNERTDELTNDLQDQGSNRLVPDAPTPVENGVCAVEYCRREADSVSWGLCRRHFHQAWMNGWTTEEMILRCVESCALCPYTGDLELDHDNSCCQGGYPQQQRCGLCARAFLCRTCNRHVRMVESHTSKYLRRLLPDEVSRIVRYLDAWAS